MENTVNFANHVAKRIANGKDKLSSANIKKLETLQAEVSKEKTIAMLNAIGCTTDFDFDMYAACAMSSVIGFAQGTTTLKHLTSTFYETLGTMLVFQKNDQAFTVDDIEIALDIKKKPAKEFANNYKFRRKEHYGSAKRWAQACIALMRELNCLEEVSKRAYKLKDNTLTQGLKAQYQLG